MTEYQENLVVLAVALGFETIEKDGKAYLVTIDDNKTKLFLIDKTAGDALLGKEGEILAIIDKRLGIVTESDDLKRRYKLFMSIMSEPGNKFWDKAKAKKQ